METRHRLAGLRDYERYSLESLILHDPNVGVWFIDLCLGKSPSAEVGEEILALMEGRGLIRKTDFGWVLRPDGRQFARNLGLIPGPSKYETDPSFAKEVEAKSDLEMTAASAKTPSVEKTWEQFLRTRDEYFRNILMGHYLPLVRYSAERLHSKLPDKVELDDLISSGIFGLMDAIDAFDPARGVKFETYCPPRIKGAILDELRSMDWVPRLVRARAHQLTKAEQSLETHLGRKPTEKETAEELNMDMEEFQRLKRDADAVTQVSLNTRYNEREVDKDICEVEKDIDEVDIIKILGCERSKDPIAAAQSRDLKNLLTKGLTRAERLIIVLYYYQEMTMKEIGATLDLSESRISQMHSSIVQRLKAHMLKRKREFIAE